MGKIVLMCLFCFLLTKTIKSQESSPSTTPPSTPPDPTPPASTPDLSTPDPSISPSSTPSPSTPDTSTPPLSTPDPSILPSSTPLPSTPDTSTPDPSTPPLSTPDPSILPSSTPPPSTPDTFTPDPSTPPPTTITTTPLPTTATTGTTRYITERSFTWTSDDIADGAENPIVFQVEEGYFIKVTVSDINMSYGNFLRIEEGEIHSTTATEGRVFANTVKGPLVYLFKTNYVNAFCENTRKAGTDMYGIFTVTFEQTGELVTTISSTTTTTVSVPPTEETDSLYTTVYLTGRTLSEYNKAEVRDVFRQCVVDIAFQYCLEQDIVLLQDITIPYVMISEIRACPYDWPDSATCVQITFKLPIFHDEAKWTGYQINSEHLKTMWVRKDELDVHQCFTDNALKVYDTPDIERNVIWWAVGISLVIVVFVVLLWFFRTFQARLKLSMQRRARRSNSFSDTASIMSRTTKNSVSSLAPHYLQDTPKFFDS